MTPIKLLDELSKEIEKIVIGCSLYKNKAIQVFKHDIPLSNEDDEDDDKYFPCIVIRLNNGVIQGINSPQVVNCDVFICTYDIDFKMQGYEDVSITTCEIVREIVSKWNVGNKFRVQPLIKWKIHEQTYPYFCGEINLVFETSSPKQSMVNSLI